MVSVKILIRAGAATMISTAAFAADMPPQPMYPPPQPVYQPQPIYQPPQPVYQAQPVYQSQPVWEAPFISGTWYLRGDVGVGVLNFSEFDHSQTNPSFVWPSSWTIVQSDIQDAAIVGFGVGYEVNNWLRFDVTGEYRSKATFKVTGSYTQSCPGAACFDVNQGNYSSAVFMGNAYLDLGTWWCLTPYIGGGVGAAYNRITGIQDLGIIADGSTGFGLSNADSTSVNLAWNVQAGVTYNVTNNFKVDFNWRYLNLGSPISAVVYCQNTASCPGAQYTLKDITSQDFRVGLRWMLQPEPIPVVMPPPQPLASRG